MKHIFIVVLLCCLGIGLHGQTQKEAGITVSGVVLDETKLLQKSGIRKNVVIELIYRGFI